MASVSLGNKDAKTQSTSNNASRNRNERPFPSSRIHHTPHLLTTSNRMGFMTCGLYLLVLSSLRYRPKVCYCCLRLQGSSSAATTNTLTRISKRANSLGSRYIGCTRPKRVLLLLLLTKVVCCVLFLLTERAKKGRTGNESNIFVKLIFFWVVQHTTTHTDNEDV